MRGHFLELVAIGRSIVEELKMYRFSYFHIFTDIFAQLRCHLSNYYRSYIMVRDSSDDATRNTELMLTEASYNNNY